MDLVDTSSASSSNYMCKTFIVYFKYVQPIFIFWKTNSYSKARARRHTPCVPLFGWLTVDSLASLAFLKPLY